MPRGHTNSLIGLLCLRMHAQCPLLGRGRPSPCWGVGGCCANPHAGAVITGTLSLRQARKRWVWAAPACCTSACGPQPLQGPVGLARRPACWHTARLPTTHQRPYHGRWMAPYLPSHLPRHTAGDVAPCRASTCAAARARRLTQEGIDPAVQRHILPHAVRPLCGRPLILCGCMHGGRMGRMRCVPLCGCPLCGAHGCARVHTKCVH